MFEMDVGSGSCPPELAEFEPNGLALDGKTEAIMPGATGQAAKRLAVFWAVRPG